MLRIFAALKIFLAKNGDSLGELATDLVKEKYLPALKKTLERESNLDEKTKIQGVIEEWESYLKGKVSGLKPLSGIAYNRVSNVAARYKLNSREQMEDLEMSVVERFLTSSYLSNVFDKFDPIQGPKPFLNFWATVLFHALDTSAKGMYRKNPEHIIGPRVMEDEGEGRESIVEKIPGKGLADPSRDIRNIDEKIEGDLLKDLHLYANKKLSSNPVAMLVYNQWMDLVENKGYEGVNLSKDVVPAVTEKIESLGKSISPATIYNAANAVKRVIVDFFEKILNVPVPHDITKNLKVAERVADFDFRRRLAMWVLGR